MSLSQGYPNTFNGQVTNQVTKNHENEFKKIYIDFNNVMASNGHAHTGNGSDGAPLGAGAIREPNPISITSALGILTLTTASNSFIVNGTEAITSITGSSIGRFLIRWNTSRTLTYNATSLILQNSIDRITNIGDIGIYEMTSAGAREIGYFPVSHSGTGKGFFRKLKIIVTSNTQATVSLDYACLNNGAEISSLSATLDKTIFGAVNGLDAGTIANSTWYNVFAIAKADGTKGVLMSLSATAPTMPSGYIDKIRLGVIKTHSDGTLLRTLQLERVVQYVVTPSTNTPNFPVMVSGVQGNVTTPTFVAVATGSFIPPTASKIDLIVFAAASIAIVSANNNVTNPYNTNYPTNPPPIQIQTGGSTYCFLPATLVLESTNIYFAGSGIYEGLYCKGWEENL